MWVFFECRWIVLAWGDNRGVEYACIQLKSLPILWGLKTPEEAGFITQGVGGTGLIYKTINLWGP